MPISDEALDAIIEDESADALQGHISHDMVLALARELKAARATIRAYRSERPHEGEVEDALTSPKRECRVARPGREREEMVICVSPIPPAETHFFVPARSLK